MTGTIRLVLRPAPAWASIILVVHALACVAAWVALPGLAALLVAAGLGVSAWCGAGAALGRKPHAVREIELKSDGTASFVDAHGEWHDAAVESVGGLGHWLAAIVLRAGRERRAVVLFEGAVDSETFRRARVWLRWRDVAQRQFRNDDPIFR